MSSASTPEVVIDWGSVTINEMLLVEQVTGISFKEVREGKADELKMLQAFALVGLRRSNGTPARAPITADELADAGDIDVQGLGGMLGERPTRAAAPPSTSKSPKPTKQRASRLNGSRS